MTRVLVDTNVLVYGALVEQGKKHTIATQVIAELIDKREMIVSIQNLAEMSRVLLEKVEPRINTDLVKKIIFGYSRFAGIIPYSQTTIVNAFAIKNEYNIHFFDALLVATMEKHGVDEIMTENTKDFSKIKWLKVTNPFEN